MEIFGLLQLYKPKSFSRIVGSFLYLVFVEEDLLMVYWWCLFSLTSQQAVDVSLPLRGRIVIDQRIQTTADTAHTDTDDVDDVQEVTGLVIDLQEMHEPNNIGWAKAEDKHTQHNHSQEDGSGSLLATLHAEPVDYSSVTEGCNN